MPQVGNEGKLYIFMKKILKNEKFFFCSHEPWEFKFKVSWIFGLLFIKLSFPERYGLPDKKFGISAKNWL